MIQNAPEAVAREALALCDLATDLIKVAEHLAPGYGMDRVSMAMALGFAATQSLYRAAPDDEAAMTATKILAETGIKSMADMISGADAHPVVQ